MTVSDRLTLTFLSDFNLLFYNRTHVHTVAQHQEVNTLHTVCSRQVSPDPSDALYANVLKQTCLLHKEINIFMQTVLFLAAVLDLVSVFWTKMLFSFSQILVTSICDSFSQFKLKNKTKEEV